MKILIVVPDTGVGGVTASAVNFSNELTLRGHKVCFLDMSGENGCAERLSEGVEMLSLSGRSRLWNIGGASVSRARGLKKLGVLALGVVKKLTIRSGLWYRLIFSKFNNEEAFDVAVAFRQCAPCYSFVLHEVKANRKIGFVHGEVTEMGDISSWQKYMTKFDRIAYVSDAVKAGFIRVYPELAANACTIYNTFNVGQILSKAEETPTIAFDPNKVNIVTVARLTMQKNIDRALRVCKMLKDADVRPFHWYVIGDGYLMEKLQSLATSLDIDDVLTFTGSMSNPFPLVKNATFTVLPAAWEAYGMVVIESFILGAPIAVTDYEALHELMTDGEFGLIAEQTDESLFEAVLRLLENRDGIRSTFRDRLQGYRFTNDTAYLQFINAIEAIHCKGHEKA